MICRYRYDLCILKFFKLQSINETVPAVPYGPNPKITETVAVLVKLYRAPRCTYAKATKTVPVNRTVKLGTKLSVEP